RKKNVFEAVAVKIRYRDSEGWGDLRFERQWYGLESVATIEEHGRIQPGRLQRLAGEIRKYLFKGGPGKGLMGPEAFAKKWQRLPKVIETAKWRLLPKLLVKISDDCLECAVVVHVTIKDLEWLRPVTLVDCVAPPIR